MDTPDGANSEVHQLIEVLGRYLPLLERLDFYDYKYTTNMPHTDPPLTFHALGTLRTLKLDYRALAPPQNGALPIHFRGPAEYFPAGLEKLVLNNTNGRCLERFVDSHGRKPVELPSTTTLKNVDMYVDMDEIWYFQGVIGHV